MRACKGCLRARTLGGHRSPLGTAEPALLRRLVHDRLRAELELLAGEDALPPRGRARALGQGDRRASRPQRPRRVAGDRRADRSRLRAAARVGHRPPLAPDQAHPPRTRDRRAGHARAARDAAVVRRGPHAGRARQPALRTAPHRRKDRSPVTERLRISEENRRWWTLAAMCFALFMVMLDNTVTNVALPSIQRSFDASLSALEWTINAYTLSFAVLLVTGGRLGDIFGRRKVFLIGVVIFGASSATIGLAPSEGFLVVSRAIQGVGAALMMPATLSIISNAFPPAERGKAIGTWAGVSAIALALGPLVGGWLTEDVTWRAIFFINVPVAVIAVAVTLFAAHESRDETASRQVDVPGIATLTIGLTALILALVEGNAWGWGSPRIIALLAAAVIGLGAFVQIERTSPAPIVDFSFFRSRSFLGANLVAFSISFGMLAVFFFLALYMQNILGYSPLQTGARFLPTTLLVMVCGPLAGRLADRIGPRIPLVIGLACVTISLAWQSRITVDTSFAYLLPAFMILGVGMGFSMSPMSTAAMNAVDRTKAGVASGTLSMTRMVGGTFGVAALGALVAAVGRHDLARSLPRVPHAAREQLVEGLGSGGAGHAAPAIKTATNQAFVDALGTGLTIAAIATAIAALLAWLLIEPAKPRQEATTLAAPETAIA